MEALLWVKLGALDAFVIKKLVKVSHPENGWFGSGSLGVAPMHKIFFEKKGILKFSKKN